MKSITTTLTMIALACSGNALAADHSTCKVLESKANWIMTAHQTGVPLSEVMERFQSHEDFEPALKPMILKAYKTFRASGEEGRKRAVIDFANEVALATRTRNHERG
jgi:hypothetical protein